MRKLLSIVITMALLCLGFSSCEKDNTFVYTTFFIGNINNGTFLSDDGIKMNVVEQDCEGRLDTMKRAFIVCDVLQPTKDVEKSIDIKLKEIHNVLLKPALQPETIDDKLLGNDPINMSNGWVTNGYLNIFFDFTYVEGSKTQHLVNLVINKAKSTDQNIVLELRHNGYGETMNKVGNDKKVKVGHGYASFPINGIIPAGKDKINFTLNWTWHVQNGSIVLAETMPHSVDGLLTRP